MHFDWDLTHLFLSKDKWQERVDLLNKKIKELKIILKSELDSNLFNKMIELKIEIDALMEQVYCYPKRFLDLNSEDSDKKTMFNEALNIYSEIQKCNIDFEKIIFKNAHKMQVLNEYQRYISLIVRKKQHLVAKNNISSYCEISKKATSLNKIYRSLVESDMSFGQIADENSEYVTLNRTNYSDFISSKDQRVRKDAFFKFNEAYVNINNTLATIYEDKVKIEIELSKMEKYRTFISKKLFVDNLPKNIIDNLLKGVSKNLKVNFNYINFKKDYLGLKEFHIYDAGLSLGEVTSIKMPLEEAIEMVKKSLSLLGEDYLKRIDTAFNEGWVDAYAKDKKRKTSYSCISYFGVPYTLLNYNENFNAVRNIAHELGHAIHTSYAKSQKFEYFEYSLFLAEIASKVNELLFNRFAVLNAKNKDEKIYILSNEISSLSNTLTGQTMLTEFENTVFKTVENSEPINAKYLNDLYYQLYKKYNGNNVSYDDEIKYGWSKIPHLFMNESYYVYQYAIGVCIASAIVNNLLNDANYKNKYLEFLKVGNSKDVNESLKMIDIDLAKPEYIQKTFDYLEEEIKALKDLLL